MRSCLRILIVIVFAILTPFILFIINGILMDTWYGVKVGNTVGLITFLGGLILGAIIGLLLSDKWAPNKEVPQEIGTNQNLFLNSTNRSVAFLIYWFGFIGILAGLAFIKKSSFVKYHFKQALGLFIFDFLIGVIGLIVFIISQINTISNNHTNTLIIMIITFLIIITFFIIRFILLISGLIHSAQGKILPLPLIGKYIEKRWP